MNRLHVPLFATVVFATAFAAAAAARPPDELYPLPADEPTLAEKQQFVFDYLAKKAGGPAFPADLPKEEGWFRCVEQYKATAKAKGPPQTFYRLVQNHLKTAVRRLRDDDVEVRREGLGIVMSVGDCAAERLQDKWLAPAIVEAFLLPNLDSADTDVTRRFNRREVVQNMVGVYRAIKDKKGTIRAYRLYMREAGSANALEGARVHLAVALMEDGQLDEALKHLEAVDPKGSLGGAVEDLLPKVKDLIAKRAASK